MQKSKTKDVKSKKDKPQLSFKEVKIQIPDELQTALPNSFLIKEKESELHKFILWFSDNYNLFRSPEPYKVTSDKKNYCIIIHKDTKFGRIKTNNNKVIEFHPDILKCERSAILYWCVWLFIRSEYKTLKECDKNAMEICKKKFFRTSAEHICLSMAKLVKQSPTQENKQRLIAFKKNFLKKKKK